MIVHLIPKEKFFKLIDDKMTTGILEKKRPYDYYIMVDYSEIDEYTHISHLIEDVGIVYEYIGVVYNDSLDPVDVYGILEYEQSDLLILKMTL